MLSLTLVPFLVASALAGELIGFAPLPQYTHEQNTATGEYGYHYSGGPSAKTEYRALDGTTTGSYSYVDAHGILQTVNYIADEFGFRAVGSNIPSEGTVPLDAPDVAATKAAHLAEHSRATLEALSHQRKKRGLLYAAPAPVVHALPLATSSQSRIDIHKSAHLVHHTPAIIASPTLLLRKKRGLAYAAAAPLPLTYSHTLNLPFATSSQSRFQIHKGAKIIEEIHTPIVAAAPIAAAPIVEAKAAIPVAAAPVLESLPLSTSSQSRFQIHKGAKIIEQIQQPVFAAPALPIAAAPAALPVGPAFAPAAPAPAALPVEAAIAEDSVIVDSA